MVPRRKCEISPSAMISPSVLDRPEACFTISDVSKGALVKWKGWQIIRISHLSIKADTNVEPCFIFFIFFNIPKVETLISILFYRKSTMIGVCVCACVKVWHMQLHACSNDQSACYLHKYWGGFSSGGARVSLCHFLTGLHKKLYIL